MSNDKPASEAQSPECKNSGVAPCYLFDRSEIVLHHKTHTLYEIIKQPNENCKMEYCNESYYVYREPYVAYATVWIRRKSEFEDGRFIKRKL